MCDRRKLSPEAVDALAPMLAAMAKAVRENRDTQKAEGRPRPAEGPRLQLGPDGDFQSTVAIAHPSHAGEPETGASDSGTNRPRISVGSGYPTGAVRGRTVDYAGARALAPKRTDSGVTVAEDPGLVSRGGSDRGCALTFRSMHCGCRPTGAQYAGAIR